MNNNLAGLSVSLFLHGALALIVLKGGALLPPSPPPQTAVPLTLAMFQDAPPEPVVQPPPVVRAPPPVAPKPPPKKVVPPPPKPPPPKRTVPRAEIDPPRPEPPPAPRVEPPPSPPAPEPPEIVARIPEPPAPVAPAAPPPPDPDAVSSYAQTLAGLIARHRLYPRLAQMRGWQGQVELQVHIAPGGRLVDVQVSRSSGFDVLDRQAVEMVQLARPLPAPPETLRGKEFTVVVPVMFRLRG